MKKFNKILFRIMVFSLVLIPNKVFALQKDETVYTSLNYLGKYKTSTVVNKLEYHDEEKIVDETELKDILNINGDEKYKKDGNTIVWDMNKRDIFYQGKTRKALPITVDIKYYLNEKKINPKKLKNKKGNIKVVMDFKNNEKSQYKGKDIYTPFVVTVGTMIDSTKNKDIEVSNGKVIETGTKSMIVAISSPGLYDSTQIQELKKLDHISFTYYTEKFSMENIYIVSTPKLLEQGDLDVFDKMDRVMSKTDELQDGTNQLEKGSKTLAEGTNTLKNELENNINELKGSDHTSVGEAARGNTISNLSDNLYSLVQNTVYNVVKMKVGKTREAIINASCGGPTDPNYNICSASITSDIILSQYTPPTYQEIITGLNQVLGYHISIGGSMPSEENKALAGLISYQVSGILSTTDYAKYILEEQVLASYITPTFNQVFNNVLSSYGGIAKKVAIETASQATTKTLESLQVMYHAISQINDGAQKLSGGVNNLNEAAIEKMSNLANKYRDYSDTISELKRLSMDYNGFTSNNSRNTKFIYKIKSIR